MKSRMSMTDKMDLIRFKRSGDEHGELVVSIKTTIQSKEKELADLQGRQTSGMIDNDTLKRMERLQDAINNMKQTIKRMEMHDKLSRPYGI